MGFIFGTLDVAVCWRRGQVKTTTKGVIVNTIEKQAMAGLEELMDLSTHEGQMDMARELIHS